MITGRRPQDHIHLPRFQAPVDAPFLGNRHRLDPTTGKRVVYTNAQSIITFLLTRSEVAEPLAYEIVAHYTALLLMRTKDNATHRPGPNVDTGEYVASWGMEMEWLPDGIIKGTVGTDHPSGRRLEFGFAGRDSLGRVYDQPPFPHLMPAWRDTIPEFLTAMRALPGILVA